MAKHVLLELITKIFIYRKVYARLCKTTIYQKWGNRSTDSRNT